jgi:hypothetical protein
MKNTITLAIFGALLIVCSGCGHNAITYGDGVHASIGYNPEQATMNATFMYGKILNAVTRDNVEIEMNGKAAGDVSATANKADGATSPVSAGTSTDGSLRVKIGRQLNGAYVDALEAGAKPEELEKFGAEKK